MTSYRLLSLALLLMGMPHVWGRPGGETATRMAEQREALEKLAFLDGTWRGSASILLPSGEKHELTQTERVGSFLEGTVKVIEGRGYEANGYLSFAAFAIISYDVEKDAYTLRSYARGRVGDFPFRPTSDGFLWEIPVGTMTIRYTAVIRGDRWHEVGERLVPRQDPIHFHEMTLTRLGDTDWPAGGAVGPR